MRQRQWYTSLEDWTRQTKLQFRTTEAIRHMVDEVRTNPALSSQKYKGNPVDVLWTNSTATVQLTCYRKLCDSCYWPVWNLLHTEHTHLPRLNDSSAPAQQVLGNFPPSSLTVHVLHSSLMASSSHSLLQKLLTTNIYGTFASSLSSAASG